MWKEKPVFYDQLIATAPKIQRKGQTMPYISANGYMFSLFNPDYALELCDEP